MKDLRIFEDYKSKVAIDLPDYKNDVLMFWGFILKDNNDQKESL